MKTMLLLISMLVIGNSLEAQKIREKFTFELRFGWIKGGEATYVVRDTLIGNQKQVYTRLHGYTTGFANALYAVNDQFESYLSPNDLLPYHSAKNLKEQNYRFTEKVSFDQKKAIASSNRSGTHFVEEGICDISAIIHHLRFSGRLEGLRKYEIIEIPFWDTNEWYPLRMRYVGIEKIETNLGRFECLRLEPMSVSGRFFNKSNPVNIWISNDSRKLPVLMELNFSIGSVKCELIKT